MSKKLEKPDKLKDMAFDETRVEVVGEKEDHLGNRKLIYKCKDCGKESGIRGISSHRRNTHEGDKNSDELGEEILSLIDKGKHYGEGNFNKEALKSIRDKLKERDA